MWHPGPMFRRSARIDGPENAPAGAPRPALGPSLVAMALSMLAGCEGSCAPAARATPDSTEPRTAPPAEHLGPQTEAERAALARERLALAVARATAEAEESEEAALVYETSKERYRARRERGEARRAVVLPALAAQTRIARAALDAVGASPPAIDPTEDRELRARRFLDAHLDALHRASPPLDVGALSVPDGVAVRDIDGGYAIEGSGELLGAVAAELGRPFVVVHTSRAAPARRLAASVEPHPPIVSVSRALAEAGLWLFVPAGGA